MKILFTADWHIKLGQKNVPIEWAKNRYDKLFRKVADIAVREKVSYVILGGDIFDKPPSMEELELYFDCVMRLAQSGLNTIIYSGNHEALKRNTTFLSNLKDISYQIGRACGGFVNIIDDFKTIDGIDFIPYNKLKEYYPQDVDFHNKILCTHVRGDIPPYVKAEVPLTLFDRWELVLAGDLHSHENSQRNIVYPGSPITTTFHRNLVDTGILLVDTETLKYEFVSMDMPQLIRKTIRSSDGIVPTDYHHTIYEIEGDMTELSNINNSNLIDKKVVKRDSDTALIF